MIYYLYRYPDGQYFVLKHYNRYFYDHRLVGLIRVTMPHLVCGNFYSIKELCSTM